MIDPTIKDQLLRLPNAFWTNVEIITSKLVEINTARTARDNRHAFLLSIGLAEGKIDGKNEQTRKAQIDQLLSEDALYQEALVKMQDAELFISMARLRGDAMRFEAEVLVAVANNDHPLLSVD